MTCAQLEAEKTRLLGEIATASIEYQAASLVKEAAQIVLNNKQSQLAFILMQMQMQGCS